MNTQASNSLRLYRGQNPKTIEALLKFQKKEVVAELMEHFHAKSLGELALRLSMG